MQRGPGDKGARSASGARERPSCASSAQLAAALESAVAAGNEPVCLVVCDQFGILHAPFAQVCRRAGGAARARRQPARRAGAPQGRAYLYENGFEGLTILVHGRRGELVKATPAELVPLCGRGPAALGVTGGMSRGLRRSPTPSGLAAFDAAAS